MAAKKPYFDVHAEARKIVAQSPNPMELSEAYRQIAARRRKVIPKVQPPRAGATPLYFQKGQYE